MVVKRQCSFCASEIEPGTGMMFVKRDGTVFHFCSGSCRKQQLHLGRVGHRFKWTRAHALKKASDRSSAAARAQAPS
ncbi:MAG: 50S ribosomal protein L24e, partial [Thermoplasmata archaeon]